MSQFSAIETPNCLKRLGIDIILSIAIYLQTILFTIPVVYNYIIVDDWNFAIPNLGDTTLQRILMLGHIIPGIICMFLYPIQRLLDKHVYFRHYYIGGLLVAFAIMTTIMGNLYIWIYSTIGGIFMSISFCIGGIIFFIVAIMVAISGILYSRYRTNSANYILISVEDFNHNEPDRMQKLHFMMINLFGAYIYASLFYRQLYFIAYTFGYPVTNHDLAGYERPLDRSFQIIFYALPLLLAAIYATVPLYQRLYLKLVLLVYYIFILIITLRFYLYEFIGSQSKYSIY